MSYDPTCRGCREASWSNFVSCQACADLFYLDFCSECRQGLLPCGKHGDPCPAHIKACFSHADKPQQDVLEVKVEVERVEAAPKKEVKGAWARKIERILNGLPGNDLPVDVVGELLSHEEKQDVLLTVAGEKLHVSDLSTRFDVLLKQVEEANRYQRRNVFHHAIIFAYECEKLGRPLGEPQAVKHRLLRAHGPVGIGPAKTWVRRLWLGGLYPGITPDRVSKVRSAAGKKGGKKTKEKFRLAAQQGRDPKEEEKGESDVEGNRDGVLGT